MAVPLHRYFNALLRHYGPQRWWPAETPFEVMVGAILTQNTQWTNVEKAIQNLKACGLMDPHKLHGIDEGTLATALRPAGYFNVKARRLKAFVEWYVTNHGADPSNLRAIPSARLREELLGVKGIGPETADSILLYALGIPSFVVDVYTYRVLSRHALVPEETTYEEMKDLFEREIHRDARIFNEFHALLVSVGKEFCRPQARCESCPLRPFLPR